MKNKDLGYEEPKYEELRDKCIELVEKLNPESILVILSASYAERMSSYSKADGTTLNAEDLLHLMIRVLEAQVESQLEAQKERLKEVH